MMLNILKISINKKSLYDKDNEKRLNILKYQIIKRAYMKRQGKNVEYT